MLRKIAVPVLILALAGCSRTGEISADSAGAGISALRSPCPHVAVPAGTGDITLFDPATSRDASAIDVAAEITNVRSTCDDATDSIVSNVTFDVYARRSATDGARDVTLPYFITMVRGGTQVVAKSIGHVTLHFDAGQARAQATQTASSTVSRAAATLPKDVRDRITRKRKAGEQDAAVDPLSVPEVRAAVLRATWEALVGFQLTEDQLKYNVTR